jgi:hypothetical protein
MFETLYWLLGYEDDEDVEYSPEKDKLKRQKYLVCKQIQDGDIPRLRSVYLRQVKPLKRNNEVIMGIPVKGKKNFFKRNKDRPFYTLGLSNHLNEIF